MENLIKIISQTNDLLKITKEISNYFNNPCMLVNANYKVISYAITNTFHDDVFNSAINRQEMTYEFVSQFEKENKDYYYLNIDKSPYKRRISRLICEGLIVGYLLIVDETKDLLDKFSLEQFQIIEGLLAKQIVFSEQKGNIFTNSIDQFLLSLLNSNINDEKILNLKIHQLFKKNNYPNALAIIDIHNYHNLDFLNDSLKRDISYHISNSHAMIYEGNILVFFPYEGKNFFFTLVERYSLNIMCSDPILKIQDIKNTYLFTRQALKIAKEIHQTCFIDDAKRYSLLITYDNLTNNNLYISKEIIDIKNYDLINKTNYLELLYLYLKNGKSLQKTCEDMFIHRNTVLYRLNNLKDKFNLDLDNTNKIIMYTIQSGILLYQNKHYDLFLI